MFKIHDIKTKVLAASFKTVEQIHKIAMVGAQAVTISADLFQTLTYHPLTQYAIDDFIADWESCYGKVDILQIIENQKNK